MGLARPLACLLAVAGLVLASGCALAAVRGADPGPVYSVAQVQAGLANHPQDWVRRTVRVRGMAIPASCSTADAGGGVPCLDRWRQGIVDPDGVTLLPLIAGASNPLLALVRRVPALDGVVRAPQVVRWGVVATYRVRLRAMPQLLCGTTPCSEALLLDAAP